MTAQASLASRWVITGLILTSKQSTDYGWFVPSAASPFPTSKPPSTLSARRVSKSLESQRHNGVRTYSVSHQCLTICGVLDLGESHRRLWQHSKHVTEQLMHGLGHSPAAHRSAFLFPSVPACLPACLSVCLFVCLYGLLRCSSCCFTS